VTDVKRLISVLFAEDPLLAEVFPEDGSHEKTWWCEDCYDGRKDQV